MGVGVAYFTGLTKVFDVLFSSNASMNTWGHRRRWGGFKYGLGSIHNRYQTIIRMSQKRKIS